MKHRDIRTLLALPFVLALTSCAHEEPEPEAGGEIAAIASVPGGTLPPAVIMQLREQYPVLDTVPAPEPKPSADASPAEIPEKFEEKLSPRVLETATGEATFYADKFEGRKTASGIPFRQNQMVAAHRGYPFGTLLRVTNLRNDRTVNVRVVDRGPHGARAKRRGTILDLSRRAAGELGYVAAGRTPIRVEVLEWGTGVPTVDS